jgi:hypothetical protein
MSKTSEEKWRDLIAAQEGSGLSVREFAKRRGVPSATMYWWRCRLRQRRAPLVPVAVVDGDCGVPAAGVDFELDLESMTLRVPRGFDAADLRRLVQALRC